ncbi:MAG: hypothetical protein K2O21_03000 [Malacoplasma sp.]|nr:hypothetical protein [Malacoplasma sp.]
MHITNKIVKKIIKTTLILCPIISIPIFSIACKTATMCAHFVGSEWKDNESVFKFNSVNYKLMENNLEIKVSVTVIPWKYGITLNSSIYMHCYPFFNTLPNVEKSIKESGFDINEEIYSKNTYIIVYDISFSTLYYLKEKCYQESESELNVPFNIHIFSQHFLTFETNILQFINN